MRTQPGPTQQPNGNFLKITMRRTRRTISEWKKIARNSNDGTGHTLWKIECNKLPEPCSHCAHISATRASGWWVYGSMGAGKATIFVFACMSRRYAVLCLPNATYRFVTPSNMFSFVLPSAAFARPHRMVVYRHLASVWMKPFRIHTRIGLAGAVHGLRWLINVNDWTCCINNINLLGECFVASNACWNSSTQKVIIFDLPFQSHPAVFRLDLKPKSSHPYLMPCVIHLMNDERFRISPVWWVDATQKMCARIKLC